MRRVHGSRLLHCAVGLLAVAAATPSLGHGFVGPGLDPSWQDALRLAFEQHRVFGRDIVFSYGPLGFLSTRVPPSGAAFAIVAVDLILMALTAWLAWTWRRAPRGAWLTALLAAAVVSVRPFLGGMDLALSAAWLGLTCVAAGSEDADGAPRAPFLALAGLALASLTFLVKANTGLVVPLVGAIWLAARAHGLRERVLTCVAVVTPVFVVVGLAIWLPVNLIGLARGTAAVAAGYQDAMHLSSSDPAVTTAWWTTLVVGAAVVAVAVHAWWRSRRLVDGLTVMVVGLLLWLTAKQGFVRADGGHAAMALRALPGVALLLVAASAPRWRDLAAAMVTVAMAAIWCVQPPLPFADLPGYARAAQADLARLARHEWPAADLRHVPTLPAGLVAGLAGGTVDVLSNDLILVTREPRLRWQPRPTLQGYVASTPALDGRNAAHWLGPDAPNALLVTTTDTCVDDRCWMDEPATRTAVWRRYVPAMREGVLLVLARRHTPLALREVVSAPQPWALGQPVALPAPATGERLRLRLPVRATLLASWQRLALRPPGLAIRFDGGLGDRSVQVWPSLLAEGVLVSPLAGDPGQRLAEASGDFTDLAPPTAVRVTATDGWGFEVAGPATLTRLTLAPPTAGDAPAAIPEPKVVVRQWRVPVACAAGHVDHWPGPTHHLVGGWAVIPSTERPADRVLFTGVTPTPRTILASVPTLSWRADVFEVTRRGGTLLSGFRRAGWFPPHAALAATDVEAWAWDAISGEAWQLCWAIPR